MTILQIRVVTNSSKQEVVPCGDYLKVKVTAKPIKGEANKEIIELLAQYCKTEKKNVKILKGAKSKRKTVEVL
ncbi:MAG: DUF167 domain-containing protein [Candidatus Micrarchaeota archaeon]